jgi:flagellar protein FliS
MERRGSMATDHYKHYQATAVTQADPVKLVEMMYEGAIRFMRIAQHCISQGDMEGAHNGIIRAYAIVAELMATLDFEQGGEIAARLEQCYDYVLHLLKEANIKKDATLLKQAQEMIEPLLESWRDAFSNGAEEPPAAGGIATPPVREQQPDEERGGDEGPQPAKSLDITG